MFHFDRKDMERRGGEGGGEKEEEEEEYVGKGKRMEKIKRKSDWKNRNACRENKSVKARGYTTDSHSLFGRDPNSVISKLHFLKICFY